MEKKISRSRTSFKECIGLHFHQNEDLFLQNACLSGHIRAHLSLTSGPI